MDQEKLQSTDDHKFASTNLTATTHLLAALISALRLPTTQFVRLFKIAKARIVLICPIQIDYE